MRNHISSGALAALVKSSLGRSSILKPVLVKPVLVKSVLGRSALGRSVLGRSVLGAVQLGFVAGVVLLALTQPIVAADSALLGPQDKSEPAGQSEPARGAGKAAAAAGPEVQAKVEAFVRLHQPQLAELLEHLKQRGTKQYTPAVRDLNRAIQRIQNLEKRDAELYAIELELWKIRSQLRLQAAKIAAKPPKNPAAATAGLKKFIEREYQQDLARVSLLRDRAAAQLASFDAQINQRLDTKSELLQKALRSWESKIKKQTPTARKASKP